MMAVGELEERGLRVGGRSEVAETIAPTVLWVQISPSSP